MKYAALYVAGALTLAMPSQAWSETPSEIKKESELKDHKIINFGDGNGLSKEEQYKVIYNFYLDQFRHFQDPLAPYFMMMSRDGNLAFGVGGAVSVRSYYDWNGAMMGRGFVPYDIAIPSDPTARHNYDVSVGGAQIFSRLYGHTDRFGDFQVYIEANFNGPGNGLLLKKAWASINDWTIGYASSSFSDPSAQVPTVDSQGCNSQISDTNALLRWMHTFRSHWVVAASIETPDNMIPSKEGVYKACADFMPNFAGFVQYQWAGMSQHVRLSGIVRGLEYRDMIAGRNHKVAGWGVHLSTVTNPVAPLHVYAAINTGKGISSMINDLQNASLDLVGSHDDTGRMYAPLTLGWYAGLQYFFSPKVFSTVMFSEQRYLPRHEPTVDNDMYKYGLYTTANVFWYPVPRCALAMEYNLGCRKNFDGRSHWSDRVSVLARYSF